MTSLQIRDQIKSLEKQAQVLKAAEIKDVIARIKQAIVYYELTPNDLFTSPGSKKPTPAAKSGATSQYAVLEGTAPARKTTKGRKLPPKFKDQNGNVWSGRGNMPRWLAAEVAAGKTVQDFAV